MEVCVCVWVDAGRCAEHIENHFRQYSLTLKQHHYKCYLMLLTKELFGERLLMTMCNVTTCQPLS